MTATVTLKPEKVITVRLFGDELEPQFAFEGDWDGHSVKAVRNLLWREYRRHTIGIAREQAKKEASHA